MMGKADAQASGTEVCYGNRRCENVGEGTDARRTNKRNMEPGSYRPTGGLRSCSTDRQEVYMHTP